jgi:hypothetical protein
MPAERTVDIPASHWLTIEAPPERDDHSPRTAAEALRMAAARAAALNRKPVSRRFGKHNGIFGVDGVAD